MESKTLKIFLSSVVAAIMYTGVSYLIRDTQYVWLLTRICGLVSYFALFATTLIGELRMLRKVKGDLSVFRFHTPLAVFSLFMVVLHGIAAIVDNFKWGKELGFVQYLGFSFGDKWLILLSLGTLGFYFMVLVAITSKRQSIQRLGFRNWKKIHYLSYVCFLVSFIHSVGLGTDIKTSALSVVLEPLMVITGSLVLALLLARIAHGLFVFEDQVELNIAALFFVMLVLGAMFSGLAFGSVSSSNEVIKDKIVQVRDEFDFYTAAIDEQERDIAQLRKVMEDLNGTNN